MAEQKKEEGKDKKEEGEAAAAPAPKKSNKMLFIIIGVVVTLLLIGGGVFFFIQQSKSKINYLAADAATSIDDTSEGGAAGDEDEIQEGDVTLGAIFPLESLVVNLSGGGFLRCQVQLEFNEREVPTRFYPRIVPVRDALINLLASKRKDDFTSKDGRDDLKAEIKDLVNDVLKKEDLKNVYFTQFVIQ